MPVTKNPRVVIPQPGRGKRVAPSKKTSIVWTPDYLDVYGLGAVLARAIRENA